MTGNVGVALKKTERSLINLKLGAYIRDVTIFVCFLISWLLTMFYIFNSAHTVILEFEDLIDKQ